MDDTTKDVIRKIVLIQKRLAEHQLFLLSHVLEDHPKHWSEKASFQAVSQEISDLLESF